MNKQQGRDIVEEVSKIANKLDLKTTKHRLQLFELKLKWPLKKDDHLTEIKVLEEAFKHDLHQCHFYYYPRGKNDALMSFAADWKQIAAAFPLVKEEAIAAVDCYALNHNTASVFHSMRVAEHGLRTLAGERRIKLPQEQAP